jgi:hypothetical protein
LDQAFDITDAIAVAVVKTPDEDLVEDGVIPPVGFWLGVGWIWAKVSKNGPKQP